MNNLFIVTSNVLKLNEKYCTTNLKRRYSINKQTQTTKVRDKAAKYLKDSFNSSLHSVQSHRLRDLLLHPNLYLKSPLLEAFGVTI